MRRFLQRSSIVPEFLRYGTLTRYLRAVASTDHGELDAMSAARFLVRPGYLDAEQCVAILESAGVATADARYAVDTARASCQDHVDRQPLGNDWRRFYAASDALTAGGILVRHNFTCCRTCADDEIKDERGTENPWGFMYFTQVDAFDLADENASVWLSYGSFGPSPRISADELARAEGDEDKLNELYERTFDHLAEAITAALTDNGLRYDWDGDTSTRIKVTGMDWRRPPAASGSPAQGVTPEFEFGFQIE